MYTASTAFLEALHDAGVSYIFANFGSDHPALLEALAQAKAGATPAPKVITCPNEMVALACAHGYAQLTGRAQAVVVHVDCGTQSLAGAIHNAARCRIPVLIFAGASPYTQEDELRGARNEFIHWLQDVFDQRGIVRPYMKYENELRTGRNLKQMVHRALQFAYSDPKGPAYLMAPREVMEEEIPRIEVDPARWSPIEPVALPAEGVGEIVRALRSARRPLAVTSYLGRNPKAVEELVRLARCTGLGILESVASYLNFPSDHPLYVGMQGNEPIQNSALAQADFVLVLDSDVPWIPSKNKPHPQAPIFHIDIDPLKENMPLWYIPAKRVFRADCATALRQIHDALGSGIDSELLRERSEYYAQLHHERDLKIRSREKEPLDGAITAEYLTACVRRHIDRDTIVLNEGITNYSAIHDHIGATQPLRLFTTGASSLGWNGGAAVGMKLAAPDKTVVSLTGDGSYMFSQPSTVHWIARRYETPFLQVIYNNRGWRAPRYSALAVHPDGFAAKSRDLDIAFDPPPDYSAIAAAAGGAFARIVKQPSELNAALDQALEAVRRQRRAAVLDVWLAHLMEG
ncbi:MAG TPA: thiamine pyrophosphate-requiring protein [Bryobacteraceae bacterium]|nr:thiamine pyrophosphate-requiring protein [Bryobacteraceae bacterium]